MILKDRTLRSRKKVADQLACVKPTLQNQLSGHQNVPKNDDWEVQHMDALLSDGQGCSNHTGQSLKILSK